MTSTAVDVCLCLLLMSAATVVVGTVPEDSRARTGEPGDRPSGPDDRADAVASLLAATTANVSYAVGQHDRQGHGDLANADARRPATLRTAHGTLASLLATAAVRTVRADGRPLTPGYGGFAAAVRRTTRAALPPATQVVVTWRPYPGSHLGRKFTVGPTPPQDAAVNAASVRSPSGMRTALKDSLAASEGFDALGQQVATAVVDGLFPPKRTRLALVGGGPVAAVTAERYRRTAGHYGVAVDGPLARGETQTANRRIAAAMGDRIAKQLRDLHDGPREAATEIEVGTVEVVVRTWKP